MPGSYATAMAGSAFAGFAFSLALIAVGIAGVGTAVADNPSAVGVVRWVGAVFLLCYGVAAARRAFRAEALTPAERQPARLRTTVLSCLAFTYLNPHVYLDTVLLVGAVAHQHPYRWLFGAGAAVASAVWFTALGVGAHRLAPVLARPAAWRLVDGIVAVLMVTMAVPLVRS